jgi:PST family polysaccharide transporter
MTEVDPQPNPSNGEAEHSTLAHRAVAGVRWGFVSTASQQILRTVFTIAIARMIGPDDFGIAATATIYVGVTQLFIDAGFGAALIQKSTIDDDDVGSVFWINMAVGAAMVIVTLLVAPWVADYFHTPELTAVLRVSSILIVINAFTVVPISLLNRELAWRPIAIAQVAGVLVGSTVGVAAAATGAGYWAVVVQSIVAAGVTTSVLLAVTGAPRVRASRHRMRDLWTFTWGLMGSRSLRFFSENVDNVLVGRYLGTAELAFYALAYRLLKLPVRLIGAVVNQVSLPAFSRMQDNLPRMKHWFLTTSRTMAVASYGPLVLGVLVMPDLIPLLFGSKWEPAVLPTQLLTLVSMRQMAMMLMGPLFQALGKTQQLFFWTVVAVAANVIGIVIGLNWGIVGVAAGLTISMYLLAPLQIGVAARLVGFRGSEYTRAVLPAWIAAAAMVVVWVPCRTALSAIGVPALAAVPVCGVVVLAAYVATFRFGYRELYDSMKDVVMMMVRRKGRRTQPRTVS